MGAKVTVPTPRAIEVIQALYKFKVRAGQGSHPDEPENTILDYRDLSRNQEEAFCAAFKKLRTGKLRFYDERCEPQKKCIF